MDPNLDENRYNLIAPPKKTERPINTKQIKLIFNNLKQIKNSLNKPSEGGAAILCDRAKNQKNARKGLKELRPFCNNRFRLKEDS